MEKVNVREFRARMSFWLENLPIQLVKNRVVIANIYPPDYVPHTAGYEVEPQVDKIEALRLAIQGIENKVPDGVVEEERIYTEYTDSGEESIKVTYSELVKRVGAKQAPIFWKRSKPV